MAGDAVIDPLFDPEVVEDPHSYYAQLRDLDPVHELPGTGTFLVSTPTNNAVSVTNPTVFTPVNIGLGGGTVRLANALTGNTQTFGALTFTASGALDFGTGNTNVLEFNSLTGVPANSVGVARWSGLTYLLSATADSGLVTQDRLNFVANPGFPVNTVLPAFTFTNDAGVFIGNGLQVTNGAKFEIVPVASNAAYWSGNVLNNQWNAGTATNTNWWTTAAGSVVATIPGIGTDVFMTANLPTTFFATTELRQNFEVNSVTFTGAGTANTAGSIVASGTGGPFSLQLDAAGGQGITVQANSGANTISANVVLGANQTWSNNNGLGNLFTVSGTVTGAGKNLTVDGTDNTTISGAIGTTTGSVTKNTAASTLSLTTVNTYTGATTVNAGTVSVGAAGSLATTAVTVAAGANFSAANVANDTAMATTAAVINDGTMSLVANQTIATFNGAATGLLTEASGKTLTVSGGGTYAGAVNGAGANFAVTGGTQNLDGVNGYAGSTTVSAGTLNVGAAGSLATTAVSVTAGATFAAANPVDNTAMATTAAVTNNGTMSLAANQTIATLNGTTGAATLTPAATKTLTVSGGGTYAGAVNGAGANLAVTGSTLTMAGASGYTGTTTVGNVGGVPVANLTVTGSLSGTTAVQVNTGGTLLLNSATSASNIVGGGTVTGDVGFQTISGSYAGAASHSSDGGTLAVATGASTQHTFSSMTLTQSSILDFSSGGLNNNTNINLFFGSLNGGTGFQGGVQTGTAADLFTGAKTLTINNWTGAGYGLGTVTDSTNFGNGSDRLIFNTDPGFIFGTLITGINFTGFGAGAIEVAFGSQFEIVPVPEPATTALIGSIALCALIGYRERRRFAGIRSRMARK